MGRPGNGVSAKQALGGDDAEQFVRGLAHFGMGNGDSFGEGTGKQDLNGGMALHKPWKVSGQK